MSMKKKAIMAASYVMVAALAIGGTVAYLTDTDEDINTMTLGNVKIEQHEYQRQVGEDGNYATGTVDERASYLLEEFEQDKPLLPTTDSTNHGAGPYDTTTVRMSQVDSYGGMQVFSNKNAQDKFVTVENTGLNDAYVRTLVAIECGSSEGSNIGISDRCATAEQIEKGDTSPWIQNDIGKININGNNYLLFEYTYRGASDVNRHLNGVLPAGDTTYPNLSQVYLTSSTTSEDVEAIDGNNNGKLDILVFSQAVQADGFDNAKTALDAAFGKTATDNHPWIKGVADTAESDAVTAALEAAAGVEDATKRVASLGDNVYTTGSVNLGGTGVTLDGAGYTLAKSGKVDTGTNAGVQGTAGTVKNLNIVDNTDKDSAKGFRAIYFTSVKGNMVVENCELDGTYAINVNGGSDTYTLTVKNTTLNGWTSYGSIAGATFTDCTFGKSVAGYAFLRAYANTTFAGCDFEAGFKVDIDDASSATLTFENCTLDGVALTSANIATLLDNAAEASAVTVK